MAEETKKTVPREEMPEEAVEETPMEQDDIIEDVAAEEETVEMDPKSEAEGKIEALTDRLTRQMAEFENFRKRTEKEKAVQFEMGARSVVEKILPVIDNFERGLGSVPEDKKEDPFVEGMEKIYKQMMAELEAMGVKPIEAVGQPFDPNRHNAVMHVEDESVGENTVVAEFQKGYTYRDSIVRYSMVQVAN